MKQKIHIGLVLSSYPGISETFFYNKLNGLVKSGFNVSLFLSRKRDTAKILKSVSIYYQPDIDKKIYLFVRIIFIFIVHPIRCCRFLYLEKYYQRSWVRSIKNMIINSHIIGKSVDWLHFGYATSSIGRENLGKAMKVKLGVSFRGFDINIYPNKHPGCYKLLWNVVDKIHTISDDLYQKALLLGLKSGTPFEKISPSINTVLFTPNKINNLHDPLRILTVGRLNWVKGHDYLLDALKLLKDLGINFECHIVGEGDCKESILYARYQLKLIECVKLNGHLSQDKIKEEMDWADIYVQPSIEEGFCNALLEAQSMGLLCISTETGGLSENIIDGLTGWLVKKRSAIDIKNKIIEVLSFDENKRREIKESAIYRVQKEFSIEKQTTLFKEFYS